MSTVNLNEVEQRAYEEFLGSHCCAVYFRIYPGSIGSQIFVCCEGCKQEQDITDYDSW